MAKPVAASDCSDDTTVAGQCPVSAPMKKPKKPLSAYNFFFSQERERMVSAEMAKNGASAEDIARTLKMAGRKKPHRKTHGTIGFITLAREIANKWKRLSESEKEPFRAKAKVAKAAYLEEVRLWKMSESEKVMSQQAMEERKKTLALPRKAILEKDDDDKEDEDDNDNEGDKSIRKATPVDVHSSSSLLAFPFSVPFPMPGHFNLIPNQVMSSGGERAPPPPPTPLLATPPSEFIKINGNSAQVPTKSEETSNNKNVLESFSKKFPQESDSRFPDQLMIPCVSNATSTTRTTTVQDIHNINSKFSSVESVTGIDNEIIPQRYLNRVGELARHFDDDCFECLRSLAPKKKMKTEK
mmetsp:Transcript_14498/g.20451  ORF Transcript_14498/g.20451 Transcript_14498/m.20451 type:complete len:355 (+) Transcript_14498:219-1283(+)